MKATNFWQYLANAQLATTAWQPNKKNNLQNTFLCQKQTQADKEHGKCKRWNFVCITLKFWLQLPYLRRVFYLYIEHTHKNRKRAKMLFCAKNKRRQTKNMANASVEILFALRWNFDCNCLTYAGFSICILSIHTKTENVPKCFFVPKTNAGRQRTWQMQALKFCLHYVEILIAIALLRIAFRGYA